MNGICRDCGNDCEGQLCPDCKRIRHEDQEQPRRQMGGNIHPRHKFIFTGLDSSHDSDAEEEWRYMRGHGIYQEFSQVKECAKLGYLGTGLIGRLEETGKTYRIYNGGITQL
jgi:hypothetical protein